MCQIIPMTNEKQKFNIRDATDNDLKWIKKREYLNNFSFIFNKNIVKKAYNRFFGF